RVVGIEAHQATQDRMIASKADQEALNAAHAKIQMVESENARLKSRADKAEKENAEIKARLDKIEKALKSK
ncbi:MAG: hypothetical protein ACKOX6_16045, partial [Bdellovibrio sp.]